MFTVVASSLILILFIKWILARKRSYRLSWQLPGPLNFPMIGSSLSLKYNGGVLNYVSTIYYKYDDIFRIWFGSTMYIFVRKSEDIQLVLEKCLNRGAVINNMKEAIGGDNLFSIEGVDKWRKRRRLISPTQSRIAAAQHLPIFHKDSLEAVRNLKSKIGAGLFNINEELSYPLTISFFKILCNKIPNPNEVRSFTEMNALLLEIVKIRTLEPWYQIDFLWNLTKYPKTMKYTSEKANIFTGDILQDKLKNGSETLSLMEILLRESEENDSFNVDDIFYEMKTMISVAVNSTYQAVLMNLLLLAMHPEQQEKVYEEIRNVFPSKDYELTVADLDKLEYLEMCMKEELRLFPGGPLSIRKVDRPLKIGKYDLDHGMEIVISFFHLHRDEKYWGKHSNEYQPERFSPENISKIKPFTYFPYGGGSRNCPGTHNARIAVKTMLINILRHYRITTPLKYDELRPYVIIGIHLSNKCLVQIYSRDC